MRLHWFLPVVRKAKPDAAPRRVGLVLSLLRTMLPRRWRSDPATGEAGAVRRLLGGLGPSWASSPVRRAAQAGFLAVFLVLFFYVCWPYSARPARIWPGWLPVEVDPESGAAALEHPHPADLPSVADTVFVAEAAGTDGQGPAVLGTFSVAAVTGGRLSLAPVQKPGPDELGRLSFSLGPWTLHEKPPGSWPSHYADDLAGKERIEAEVFLALDPLVSLSTALAARTWVWTLAWAGAVLLVCAVVPRGFCGYVCPLGTTIDLFDWLVGRKVPRLRVADSGWWVHLKYYLLAATLAASLLGVLVTGFVAAIPVITRGLVFTLKPLHDGWLRGWHNVPPVGLGPVVSVGLFVLVLALGLLKPRFWCKYVCPSGAVFSLGNLLRLSERKVEASCIHCHRCVEVCPFDAIKPDFTTRVTDCTLCQTCGGVCPTHAIKFVERTNRVELKAFNEPPTGETRFGRRGLLSAGAGLSTGVIGGAVVSLSIRASTARAAGLPLVRPPGSVPEPEFRRLCIRCGECFRACPNDVLQPLGLQRGIDGLWTPYVNADWSGCEPSCNNCGQVCPTGAIRAVSLDEKRAARMGLAVVNAQTCLPFVGREACQLCVDECTSAGYAAIEFIRVGTLTDTDGSPLEGSGLLAPVVRADRCVGCGLCQTRCYWINVREKKLLRASAIVVEAGPGREDRVTQGSYLALAKQRSAGP